MAHPSPTLWELKGVGFLLACLPAKLPSKGLLLPCERDARAPSTRDAGNAGVPPAIPTTREKKPTPLSLVGEGLGVRAESGRTLHTANPSDVPSPPLSPSPAGGRGGLWSAEAQLPPTLKLTLQHSKQVSARLTPLPPCGRGAGGEGKDWAHPAHSEPKRCTLGEDSAHAEADASALQKRVRMMQRAYRRQLKERGAGRPPALAAGRDEPPVPPARSVLCASDSK
jgi:hypothetical protein